MKSFAKLIIVTLLPMFAAAHAGELYRWVDENGRVHYGDRIPPQYSKSERQKLDDAGRVKETLGRQLTDEELVEKERLEEIERQKVLAAKEQERYDKFLVSTYETPATLVDARDDRLSTLDGQILANEKSVSDTERILQDLHGRAAKYTDRGDAIPKSLEKQIAQWDDQLVKGVRSIELLRNERAKAEERFETDLKRYMYLKGIQQ